jgi:hypothetical protein
MADQSDAVRNIEHPIGDLEIAVKALHLLADSMDEGDGDNWCLVRFMANHFGEIHRRLLDEFEKAIKADRLKTVS